MKTKQIKPSQDDVVKANRRGARDAELENETGFKSSKKVHKTLKAYSKKDRRQKINIYE